MKTHRHSLWLLGALAIAGCALEDNSGRSEDDGASSDSTENSGGSTGSGGDVSAVGGTASPSGGQAAAGGQNTHSGAGGLQLGAGGTEAPSGGQSSASDGGAEGNDASGGDPGTGGEEASGGDEGVGGNAASGGDEGVGGSTNSGGVNGAGGNLGTGGNAVVDPFVVEVILASDVSLSAPTTVGIVTFSIDGVTPVSAHIEFGLTTSYGMTAPVDLSAAEFRTVLLGMKPESDYHFRIVVEAVGGPYLSDDYTLTTGVATTKVSIADLSITDPTSHEPGFMVTSYSAGTEEDMAFILDQDGEVVWWYDVGPSFGGIARAAMSADGKNMWLATANFFGAALRRVSIDTLESQTYPATQAALDLQPVTGSTMAFIDYGTECSRLMEITPNGTETVVYNLEGLFGPRTLYECFGNSLGYSESQGAYAFSSVIEDILVLSRNPLGGLATLRFQLSDIVAGGNADWGLFQTGTHLLANSILVFANEMGANTPALNSGGPSTIVEFSLPDGSELWRYESTDYTANLGSVQRLPGGNTLLTFSNAGLIREVNPAKETVMEVTSGGDAFGFVTWRDSLYGLPSDMTQD